MEQQKITYTILGPLTLEDMQRDIDVLCGHEVNGYMVAGNAMPMNAETVLFNPLTDFDFFKVPLSEMVRLEEVVGP